MEDSEGNWLMWWVGCCGVEVVWWKVRVCEEQRHTRERKRIKER